MADNLWPVLVALAALLAYAALTLSAPADAAVAASQLRSGGRMPLVGAGTWQVTGLAVQNMVREAVLAGYRAIDTATMYGNERDIGAALQGLYDEGVVTRGDLFLTTKLPNTHHEDGYATQALAESLRALRTSYVDLWLMHWPVALRYDTDHVVRGLSPDDFITHRVTLADTWRVMYAEQQAGRVRAIGVSNFNVRDLKALIAETGIVPDVNQVERHPYLQQPRLFDYCRSQGIHVTAYSALGSSGRPERLHRDGDLHLLSDPVVLEVAEEVQRDAGQVLLRWALQHGTSVIPKSEKPHRLRSNAALFDFTLDADAMARLDALDRGWRFVHGEAFLNGRSPEEFWDEP